MIGRNGDRFFVDAETGLLGQFRRQYFLLGLIAHFHKAALLMLSDRLVVALADLRISDVESIKRFKRRIRRAMETFLRFTHRYWFQEVSTLDQSREIFGMWRRHLGTERLYAEVREEIQDMSTYLANDSLRRQANTVVRLTVVTTLGLVATVVTGVLGMNIFAEADDPWYLKLLYVVLVLVPTTLLILLTVYASKALAARLETLSERSQDGGAAPEARPVTPAGSVAPL
jgi:Mg2+ and Co2+ transporter CorA